MVPETTRQPLRVPTESDRIGRGSGVTTLPALRIKGASFVVKRGAAFPVPIHPFGSKIAR